jgi:hypothetical protein
MLTKPKAKPHFPIATTLEAPEKVDDLDGVEAVEEDEA